MWFQDLFNYDFRRTEQCIIPYATQEGEISFCAYNTGVGWRNIIEKMHMTATLTKWYEEHGRHEIFAGGKKVGMSHVGHELVLNMEHVNSEANHTLDNLGIAKNAREEKIRARDKQTTESKLKQDAENAHMAKLYREHVLGEKPVEGLGEPGLDCPGKASHKTRSRAGCRRLIPPPPEPWFSKSRKAAPIGAAFMRAIELRCLFSSQGLSWWLAPIHDSRTSVPPLKVFYITAAVILSARAPKRSSVWGW